MKSALYPAFMVGLAALARQILQPHLVDELPLILFLIPVLVSALWLGPWAGLVATAYSGLVGLLLFVSPRWELLPLQAEDSVRLAVFTAEAVILTVIGARFRSGQLALLNAMRSERHHRRLAEQELRERQAIEAELNLTFESADVGIAHIDRTGRWLKINQRLALIAGYDRAALLEKTLAEITLPADAETDRDLADRLWRGEIPSYTVEKRWVRADGSIAWVLVSALVALSHDDEPKHFILVAQDISENKAGQEALKTSQAQLMAAFQAMSDGVMIFDRNGTPVLMNEAALKMSCANGGPEGSKKDLGYYQSIYRLTDLDGRDVPFSQWPLSRVLRGESVPLTELRTVRLDTGVERLHAFSGEPILNGHGEVELAVLVNRDITAVKGAELALKNSEALLNLATTSAKIGVWEWHIETGEVRYSAMQWQVMNFAEPLPTFTAHEFTERVHEEDRESVTQALRKSIDEHTEYRAEFRYRGGDDRWIWLLGIGRPEYNESGRAVRVFGINMDITQRKNAQIEFERAVDVSPAILWTSGADGRCSYLSQQWYEFTGQSKEHALGNGWQDAIHPDDRANAIRTFEQANQNKEPVYLEYRLQHRSGQYRWAIDAANPRFDKTGRFLGYAGSVMDIHDQKLAAAELVTAKHAAEEANAAKSRFLANMSHEIRSPMNSVLGYATLLAEDHLSPRERQTYANRIRVSGEHLLHLLNDILDLSKVEAGQIKTESREFAAVDLVSDCLQSSLVFAGGKPIEFKILFDSPVPRFIKSDPVRFRQILMNLIGNAIKFTYKGHIHARLGLMGDRLIVDIEDSGIGIAADKQAQLFQSFTQADASITRRYGGTGLGLYLSRRLARNLGGELSLQWSLPGKGSLFRFSIPVGQTRSSQMVRAESECLTVPTHHLLSRGPAAKRLRVLLVEDSPDNQELMRLYLNDAAAHVDVAENGIEAFEKAMKGAYDIVLMDIMMPIMDGLAATTQLRNQGYRKPIIALTAHAMRDEVERSLAAGCDAHLAKPVNRSDLIALMRQLTGNDQGLTDFSTSLTSEPRSS